MLVKAGALLALCILAASYLQPATAVDYPGGWLPSPPRQQCVDICVDSKPKPTCPTNDTACLAKKQQPRDYDYLVLEQLFIPQYCRDLLHGVDSTLAHRNVRPYPSGITCNPTAAQKTQMTIHGLWPTYNAGYASCCNASLALSNHPYNALAFATQHLLLLTEMRAAWIDPTQNSSYSTLCELYNHEFQKHGVCYGTIADDWSLAAAIYFRAALNAASTHANATQQLNAWAADAPMSRQTTLTAIAALFPTKIQVLCSAVDGGNQLAAVRTCFDKPRHYSSRGPFVHRDCADATTSAALKPCDRNAAITLLPYSGP